VFDDIQMAWRYGVEQQQLAEIQQLAAGLQVYYRLHSWYRAGSGALAVYQRALTCFDANTKDREQRTTLACLFESIGDLQGLTTTYDAALSAYEKALEFSAERNYIEQGRLYGKIADTWVTMNQHETGHEYFTLAESILAQAPHRTPAWWREWLRIQTQRMELFYWQGRPDDMDALAQQIQPLIEQHGSVMQRVRFLYLLGMMTLRRVRYGGSHEAIVYSEKALALSLETGNLGEIAYRHFSHGFSHLWSNHLDEAEAHLEIARVMTEQSGDLLLLSRVLTYLTVVYRKRKDLARMHVVVAESIRIAEEAKMAQYTGMAHAQYAWLAWRDGEIVETKRQAQAAIEDWDSSGPTQFMIPFRWLALFPLLDIALQEDDIGTALQWARHMVAPNQQRLPDALTDALERAVSAEENSPRDAIRNLLRQAVELAQTLDYI
jgi:eukaryotic-like serine/threonine-protein kinase